MENFRHEICIFGGRGRGGYGGINITGGFYWIPAFECLAGGKYSTFHLRQACRGRFAMNASLRFLKHCTLYWLVFSDGRAAHYTLPSSAILLITMKDNELQWEAKLSFYSNTTSFLMRFRLGCDEMEHFYLKHSHHSVWIITSFSQSANWCKI